MLKVSHITKKPFTKIIGSLIWIVCKHSGIKSAFSILILMADPFLFLMVRDYPLMIEFRGFAGEKRNDTNEVGWGTDSSTEVMPDLIYLNQELHKCVWTFWRWGIYIHTHMFRQKHSWNKTMSSHWEIIHSGSSCNVEAAQERNMGVERRGLWVL